MITVVAHRRSHPLRHAEAGRCLCCSSEPAQLGHSCKQPAFQPNQAQPDTPTMGDHEQHGAAENNILEATSTLCL